MAPDALLALAQGEPLSDWLVDEAAAIPGPLLTKLCRRSVMYY
jgi:tRNA(Met) C34 N-acetyltransferase TmcA